MPNRRKRSLKLDRDRIAAFVIERLDADLTERDEWNNRRIERYAKFRGWLPERNWPWPGSSNFWVPVMTIAALRTQSLLFNAITSFRPIISARALQRRNMDRQSRVDSLLDWQMFVEQDGIARFDDFSTNFVNDGTAFAFVRWVHERQSINDVRVFEAVDEFLSDPTALFEQRIAEVFGDELINVDDITNDGWTWRITLDDNGIERDARVDFFEIDDDARQLEMHIQREVLVKDGPAVIVEDLEDIVAPWRSANLQPPSADNPYGAPYVNRIGNATLDEIRRRVTDGTYDLVTDADMTLIATGTSPLSTGVPDERQRENKDAIQGVVPQPATRTTDDGTAKTDIRPHQIIEHYGRWDVNGDGLDEDVIFWVHRQSKVLLRARYLTEIYPGLPIQRPIAEARFIPAPNQLYGIGLLELVEPLYDIYKSLMDMNIDWGEIRNTPFWFYRASSSTQPEIIRLAPGDGFPLDNPQTDVHFPRWGNENNIWVLNTMNMVQQMIERLSMVSDVQLGRIPTGKASALRTMGTTMALLQQGDVRSEQVLRRLFVGVRSIYRMMHRLDRANLPRDKEVRVLGYTKPGEEFVNVSRDGIDFDVDFDFKATILNTNRAVQSQIFERMMGVLITPLALQLRLTTPATAHRIFRDYIEALNQDPDQYVMPPTDEARGPSITAEEAISAVLSGEIPDGTPVEPIADHLRKLVEFQQSDDFGHVDTREELNIWRFYLASVQQRFQQEQRQQQLAAAAQQLQQGMAGGGGGDAGTGDAGGVPTTFDSDVEQPSPSNGLDSGTVEPTGGADGA